MCCERVYRGAMPNWQLGKVNKMLINAVDVQVGDIITLDGESHTVTDSHPRAFTQFWEIWTYPTNRPRAGAFVRYPNQSDPINLESR